MNENTKNENQQDLEPSCVTICYDKRSWFEEEVTEYLKRGYKVSSSSCNSKDWKAIMIKEA